ncbi:hypothetical protein EV361DRAFT_550417 [Lentinula raphanica]|uniref:Transmembrane protein n=1 Tax=Lentinula raphanica TaxID=153919 RepID=A0AA38P3N9_9AGAR|nr:hypothetical protein C8R42DRAFT_637225 [Lentinula raphanica]KAJ3827351.1 hypothetical protein F5880DRAFT_1245937 [Lentinula raphanica]KAJ3835728.1 hypothetical protein F5878DRAFT_296307 [Lentinula raphanica]KAJ3975153.1 hypothetical protein EV361DRAFT_550417 [Lentinula raphanica]
MFAILRLFAAFIFIHHILFTHVHAAPTSVNDLTVLPPSPGTLEPTKSFNITTGQAFYYQKAAATVASQYAAVHKISSVAHRVMRGARITIDIHISLRVPIFVSVFVIMTLIALVLASSEVDDDDDESSNINQKSTKS